MNRVIVIVVGLIIIGGIASLGVYLLSSSTPPPPDRVSPSISILECEGRCGDIGEPSIDFRREGDFVLITYQEPTSVPCFRHVITDTVIRERFPPSIDIELRLESTEDQCIECVGVVESTIRIGPVPIGTDIALNGLRIVV